jgi:hypothetical protein
MRAGLTVPAFSGLQVALHRVMELQPQHFGVELSAMERETSKLRNWIGNQGSVKPPQDASRAALRDFVSSHDLPTLRHATLASFGCIDPFDNHKAGLISDPELFAIFLIRVDDYRDNPRALRLCYGGLLHAYFRYDAEAGSMPGRENWSRLRTYLGDRADAIGTPGFQPVWVDTLHRNREVLGSDAGAFYGMELFQGRSERFDEVRKGLAVADASWLVWRVVVGQIEAATRGVDPEFHAAISGLLELLRKHPLARNFGLAKLLDRYRESASPTLHAELRDAAVDAWGNPWLSVNAAKWSSVREDARRMVAEWLKLALIQKFFSLLAEDGRNDTRRLNFWESYHQSIHAMYFALGDNALTHPGPDYKDARKQMEGLLMTLTQGGSRDNNAFIMCIGEHVVVEFGVKGNACHIFKRDRLPFKLSGAVAGNSSALKHHSHVERLLHKDGNMGTWEDKFRTVLTNVVKARGPTTPVQIVRDNFVDAQQRRPKIFEREPIVPKPVRIERPGWKESAQAHVPEPKTLFSVGELAKFCEVRKLQWSDYRSKGGNLWVYTRQQGGDVAGRLTEWGFHYKNPNGWWRQ